MTFDWLTNFSKKEVLNFFLINRVYLALIVIQFSIFYLTLNSIELLDGFNIIKCLLSTALSIVLLHFLYSVRKRKMWNDLTLEEKNFIAQNYINRDSKTYDALSLGGTYQNSGIIRSLINKKIVYLVSVVPELRNFEFFFPINMNDDAFKFFKKKLNKPKP